MTATLAGILMAALWVLAASAGMWPGAGAPAPASASGAATDAGPGPTVT